MTVCFTNI